jgi:hypothetical protein
MFRIGVHIFRVEDGPVRPVEQEPLGNLSKPVGQRNRVALCADAALSAKIHRRGTDDAQLLELHASELQREAQFDHRPETHRNRVAFFLLHGDPKWTIAAIIVGITLAVASEILPHYR